MELLNKNIWPLFDSTKSCPLCSGFMWPLNYHHMLIIQLLPVIFAQIGACHLQRFPLHYIFKDSCFPSLSLSSLFSLKPLLRASILSFQTKLLSSPLCLVPTCWLCFLSPSLQSGDTGGSGPLCCVFDHSCDLHSPQEEKHMQQTRCIHSGGVERQKILSPCRLIIQMPDHPP